jgi:chromate transport protein ChrA
MSKAEAECAPYTSDNGSVEVEKEKNGSADTSLSQTTFDFTPNQEPATTIDSPVPINAFEDNTNLPKMNLLQLFIFFFVEFGLMAWGGPVAQIARIKERLVVKRRWITVARFNRVYAVYQMLPGPEAAEICMFFGCLVGGRLGGLVAGLGFILPGFLAMLLLSYLYTIVGLDNVYFNASFRALQPVVAAMVLKAVFKIGEHAFVSNKTKKFNHVLFILAILSALQSALRINYFITLGVFGIFYRYVQVSRTLAIWIPAHYQHVSRKDAQPYLTLPFLFFPFCFTVCGLVAGDGPRESSCF